MLTIFSPMTSLGAQNAAPLGPLWRGRRARVPKRKERVKQCQKARQSARQQGKDWACPGARQSIAPRSSPAEKKTAKPEKKKTKNTTSEEFQTVVNNRPFSLQTITWRTKTRPTLPSGSCIDPPSIPPPLGKRYVSSRVLAALGPPSLTRVTPTDPSCSSSP